MAGVPLAPILARRMEKKSLVIVGLLMFCLVQGGLSSLRALNLFTPTGDATFVPLGLAGVGLDIIRFPRMAAADGVANHLSPAMLSNLTWASGPSVAVVSAVATCILFLYRIDCGRHSQIVEALHARKAAEA